MQEKRRHTLVLGFASQVGSRLFTMALSIFSIAILARLLTPQDFGTISVALTVVALADAVFDGAFAFSIINRKILEKGYIETAFNISLILAIVLATALLLFADSFAEIIPFPNVGEVLKLMSVTLVIKAAGMIPRNLLAREQRLVELSMSAIAAAFLGSIVVSCGLAYLGYGVWSLAWGAIATTLVETIINFRQARPALALVIDRDAARDVISNGSLYSISQILNWGVNSGTSLVAARVLGPADLGFYSRGNKLLELTTAAIGQPLMRVFLPSFARMKEDKEASRTLLVRALSTSGFVFGMIGALASVNSAAIIELLLGHQWDATIPVASILFLSLLPRCNYKITESAAFGLGAASLAVRRQAMFAVVSIGAVFMGSQWGLHGVAIGVALSIWINYLISLTIAAKLVGMTFQNTIKLHAIPLALSGVTAAVNLGMLFVFSALDVWLSRFISGILTLFVVTSILAISPSRFLSEDITRFRAKIGKRVEDRSIW
ncbi:oligosaccharide flippase family protein [Agrobacterium cavarae]|uniref:oligosaccharide flippase family protein n=1 Tax=Agrobacterium cavarae TaxID=2528239 RepID=UPI0028A63D7E|nr:oligosaccharide flippase family protein [Agrobacterium cavarae]